jgi:hypothetical protein
VPPQRADIPTPAPCHCVVAPVSTDPSRIRGRFRRLSLQRRWIADLAAACAATPVVGAERVLRVGEAANARRAVLQPPGWTAIIIKAYALVAARRPALRRVLVSLPWPHLYESPVSVVSVIVERTWHGESAVFFDQIRAPETMALADIDRAVQGMRQRPIESVGGYRRLIRFTRLPLLLRRCLWRIGLRGSGYLHARYFGTFSINSITLPRAGVVQSISPITMSLINMPLEPSGQMRICGVFDHRVLDGMEVGRALGEIEAAINGEITAELRALAARWPAEAGSTVVEMR